jgi:hypothetical protein
MLLGACSMFVSERQLGILEDLLLPLDVTTRYDVYFTDKRIAIVSMGHSSRFDSGISERRSYLFGVAPEALTNSGEERKKRQIIEAQIKELTLDEKMKLSKKSCFYTYSEIEEVKLILGKKSKLTILSKECISKFSPNKEQVKQLIDLLPSIEMLKKKFSIFGKMEMNVGIDAEAAIHRCKYCNYENDIDAIFCQGCGKQIQQKIQTSQNPTEVTCDSCGTKNKVQALFCKKCGAPISKNQMTV